MIASSRIVVPAVAAAALAVTSGAEVAVDLRVWGPSGGLVGCLSVMGDLASSLVRHTAAATSTCLAGGALAVDTASVHAVTLVEVGLFGVQDVVAEVIHWIPPEVPEVSDPELAGVHVAVAAADDAVSCWQQTWAPVAGTGVFAIHRRSQPGRIRLTGRRWPGPPIRAQRLLGPGGMRWVTTWKCVGVRAGSPRGWTTWSMRRRCSVPWLFDLPRSLGGFSQWLPIQGWP